MLRTIPYNRKDNMSKKSMQRAIAYSNQKAVLPEAVTDGQRKLSEAIDHNRVIFVTGPAGSGKTFVSVARAIAMLRQDKVKKIVLTRPVVEAGEQLGFLPGALEEKIDPYLKPLYDAIQDMTDKYQLQNWLTEGTVEIAPLAYMRGRTFNDAVILFDEAQNATRSQIKMVLTRIGHNTKVIVNGDIKQIDIDESKSGLAWTEHLLEDVKDIAAIHLSASDIVRDDIVADIISKYEEGERQR